MMNKIQSVMAKRAAGEKGFTLVELLVVVVILVVLAAIAVPLFLNQKTKAESAKAQTNVATVASALATGKATGASVNNSSLTTLTISSTASGDITVGKGGSLVTIANWSAADDTPKAWSAPATENSTFCVSQANPDVTGATEYWKMTNVDSSPQSSSSSCA